MGTLRIHGVIDLIQFWPNGEADADTTKIQLEVREDAFEYREEGEERFAQTNAFEGAVSKGQGSKEVIKTKSNGTRVITARLQGIDAPELHYSAPALRKSSEVTDAMRKKYNELNKPKRKQCFAESSTVALATYLGDFAGNDGRLACTFETEVNAPYEAIDTYGRFVGNIFLTERQEINLWLIENGWALPAFYTSMSQTEIERFLAGWQKGKRIKNRPSKYVSKDAGEFNWDMVYRRLEDGDTFEIGDDTGYALIPKIFRRQVAWHIAKKAGVVAKSISFTNYLKKSPDQFVLLDDFLKLNEDVHSAIRRNLHGFIGSDNQVQGNPEDFVFQEKPGTLVDKNNNKITEW